MYKLNKPSDLLNMTVEELMTIEGIGIAKASTLVAALELFKRITDDVYEIPEYITKHK